MPRPSFNRRASSGLVAVVVLAGVLTTSGLAVARQDEGHDAAAFQGEGSRSLDLDARGGRLAPGAAQRAAAADLNAIVRWNRLGTPASLVPVDGALATGLPRDAAQAARTFLERNAELFRLSVSQVDELELLYEVPLGSGYAVMFRQLFDGLSAGQDGLIAMAVVDGEVVYASSSLVPDGTPPEPTMSAVDAVVRAAADVGLSVGPDDILEIDQQDEVTVISVAGLTHPAQVRLVAVPLPGGEVRSAHEVVLVNNEAEPLGVRSLVDARTGGVLVREDLVDHLEPSKWKVFPASPPLDYSSADTREVWCWEATGLDCERIVGNSGSPLPWDVFATTGLPSFTSDGNNAVGVENWFTTNPFVVGVNRATPRPGQDYVYDWTNQWLEQRCNPATTFTSVERNDIDAAIANLFAMHNRMHDWSYHLGFTELTFNLQRFNFGLGGAENDPEQGNAQAGGVVGGPPGFGARDNANQITPVDGMAAITNMYLWQPIAGAFYAPCVDGDFDMTVIGHEYTHAISNRMVAGPSTGLTGSSSRAMGESWSDLAAMEILNEYGFVPVAGENPYAIGPYVTGDQQAGIRNYGMNVSPLNFSDVGYDFACNVGTCPLLTQVHADGEIWSAVNFDIREAMNDRYDAAFPSSDPRLQLACAEGLTPPDQCPGNRRWVQLMFDAWLLMATGTPTMLDARDAMLASDLTRFGGANQDLLWNAFARRGFGEGASQATSEIADPVASFTSPHLNEATVTFEPIDLDGNSIVGAQLFVGRYEARVTPVADTDAATLLTDTVEMVPGTYELLARADGFGTMRFALDLKGGQDKLAVVTMPPNLASASNAATATGDGTNVGKLIDDTEASNWAYLGAAGTGAAGRSVTVRLDPSRPWWQIDRIQVSALLRHRIPADPGGDTGTQNRFSALRSFEIWTCQVTGANDCTQDEDFVLIFTSAPDAFPAIAPRPRAPDLLMREFDVPKTKATYVRLVVLTNQCTGTPAYAGDQDDDPLNTTDCAAGSLQDDFVRAAELQVFQK
ncbi:MAG: M36 family metallopeptidase [Actinobacteria bacterium]|nr:M36 family metallopeptidase [Actinomycetota bacterium]